MEDFASREVAEGLAEAGVDVRTGDKATAVSRNGQVTLKLEGGDSLEADVLLVAIGRSARTDGLGLESVGLEVDGYLEVDDRMRVSGSEWLYAIGDVNGRALLTHMGKYQARICADNLLGKDIEATADRTPPPQVVFTEPQVASVGHTMASAEEAGINARAVDAETSKTAGASFVGRDAPGTSRLVVDESRGVVVGATFVGPEVAEWLHAATIAVACETPMEALAHAVAAYPTRSEIWLKLIEEYGL
jgi:dihydrolipoamide dehydrogenase